VSRILLIFKKDAVHLWPQIAAFLAMLVLFACTDQTYVEPGAVNLSGFLVLLLPISCWLLVTSLVQQERAIGDKQYWLTRPFNLRHLLAAKALFLVVFAVVPVFVCQAIVLSVVKNSPGLQLGNLAVKQIFYVAWFLLPMAAVAAVTKNLGEAFLGALLVLLLPIPIIWIRDRGWNGLAWIPEVLAAMVALCGAAAAIYVQYTRRRAALGRCVLAAAAILVGFTLTLPPAPWAFALQSWLSKERVDPREVHISLDSKAPPELPCKQSSRQDIRCWIPVRIDNVPSGRQVVADWVRLDSPLQARWSGTPEIGRDTLGNYLLRFDIPEQTWERLQDTPVRVRGLLDLTVVAPKAPQCAWYCLWNPNVFEPAPISPWFGPLELYKKAGYPLMHPVAHIQRQFDLGPLRLFDFMKVAK
jgi:hypothetical protein